MTESQKVFISYAWGDAAHEARVKRLAGSLRANGIEVLLDTWEVRPGNSLPAFMQRMVNDPGVHKVLILLSPSYKEKADGFLGGVGTEAQIISGKVYADVGQNRVVPVKFVTGEYDSMTPTYLSGRLFVPFDNDDRWDEQLEALLDAIENVSPEIPPLGPTRKSRQAEQESRAANHQDLLEMLATLQREVPRGESAVQGLIDGNWAFKIDAADTEFLKAVDWLVEFNWVTRGSAISVKSSDGKRFRRFVLSGTPALSQAVATPDFQQRFQNLVFGRLETGGGTLGKGEASTSDSKARTKQRLQASADQLPVPGETEAALWQRAGQPGALHDYFDGLLAAGQRVRAREVIEAVAAQPELAEPFRAWFCESGLAQGTPWLGRLILEVLTRNLSAESAEQLHELIGPVLSGPLALKKPAEALTLFRLLLTATEQGTTWEDEVWNLLLVAAQTFWVDKDGEPQEYRSAQQRGSVLEDVLVALLHSASRSTDASRPEGVNLIYSVLGHLLLQVHDIRIIESLNARVTWENEMALLTHDTINDLLNALDHSRRPEDDEDRDHRQGTIDLVAQDLLGYLKALQLNEEEFAWSVNRAGLRLEQNGELKPRRSAR